ncbi:MAG: hypothetical protein PHP42_10760 [Bacteroidota bacterium]|nr:hypothetical protein [Bacteroidota bacterium]
MKRFAYLISQKSIHWVLWLFIAVEFIDASNIADIALGNSVVVIHPESVGMDNDSAVLLQPTHAHHGTHIRAHHEAPLSKTHDVIVLTDDDSLSLETINHETVVGIVPLVKKTSVEYFLLLFQDSLYLRNSTLLI